MELLQWHKVCEIGGEELHRPPVVALRKCNNMAKICIFSSDYLHKGLRQSKKQRCGDPGLEITSKICIDRSTQHHSFNCEDPFDNNLKRRSIFFLLKLNSGVPDRSTPEPSFEAGVFLKSSAGMFWPINENWPLQSFIIRQVKPHAPLVEQFNQWPELLGPTHPSQNLNTSDQKYTYTGKRRYFIYVGIYENGLIWAFTVSSITSSIIWHLMDRLPYTCLFLDSFLRYHTA